MISYMWMMPLNNVQQPRLHLYMTKQGSMELFPNKNEYYLAPSLFNGARLPLLLEFHHFTLWLEAPGAGHILCSIRVIYELGLMGH